MWDFKRFVIMIILICMFILIIILGSDTNNKITEILIQKNRNYIITFYKTKENKKENWKIILIKRGNTND